MSLNDLPNEILENIFQQLLGCQVVRCRAVCRRWLNVIDALPETYWKHVCLEQHSYWKNEYAAVQKKYGLSWRDTYKALNSWDGIDEAPMNIYEVSQDVKFFKVLPKGIVAMLKCERHKPSYEYADTVVYYDVEKRTECGREEFDFEFCSRHYDENEHFWVLVKRNGTLCIVPKINKKKCCVGRLKKSGGLLSNFSEEHFNSCTMLDDEVYFQDANDDIIYVAKLKGKNAKTTVKTRQLEAFDQDFDSFSEYVVAFCKNNGELGILTDEGNITFHHNADFGCVSKIDLYNTRYEFECDELRYHGFDWTSPAIYNWLTPENSLVNVNPMFNAFYGHGNVLLAAPSFSTVVTICVHNGQISKLKHAFKFIKRRPTMKIDLKMFLKDSMHFKSIKQLDIIENGVNHSVLVLAENRLFVFEFQPNCRQPMVLRSRPSGLKVVPKNVGMKKTITIKKKKAPKYVASSIKKRYATRSSTKLH